MFAFSEDYEADAPHCSRPLRTLRQDFGCSESYEDRDFVLTTFIFRRSFTLMAGP
jgi:hypothetical protein